MIYIREAHPTDGWQVESNIAQGVLFPSHETLDDRHAVASACSRNLQVTIPMLVDDMENSADTIYRGWPERLYVVGDDGRIAYQGAKGPYGFDPEGLNRFLVNQPTMDSEPA